jgi:hypothetical protein
MGSFIDLTGQTFGTLRVLSRNIKTDKKRNIYWDTECLNCKVNKIILGDSLRSGATKTCNCQRIDDLTDQIFGNLKVLSKSAKTDKYKTIYWNCQCLGCGTLLEIIGNSLKSSHSKSCGNTKTCSEAFNIKSEAQTIHGLSSSIEYLSWIAIKTRCYNMDNENYPYYGGRGITMYSPWINDPVAFYDYLLTLPETRLQFEAKISNKYPTIDRIDVNGNYEPGNIRWATVQEQSQNKRNNVLTEQLVKIILWEFKLNNKSIIEIFEM